MHLKGMAKRGNNLSSQAKHVRIIMAMIASFSVAEAACAASGCHVLNYGALPVEIVDGRPTTLVKVNGRDARLLIDTGSFYNFMSREDVKSMALRLEAAPTGLRVDSMARPLGVQLTHVDNLGMLKTTLHNVTFIVGATGETMGVLGANLLDLGDLDIDLAGGKMTLLKPTGCRDTNMAYWAGGASPATVRLLAPDDSLLQVPRVIVLINGKPLQAILSTDGTTAMSRHAAERVGIDLASAPERTTQGLFGFGARPIRAWTVSFAGYQIGPEHVRSDAMVVVDSDFTSDAFGIDMIVGEDFFITHHVFVARSQGKIYFTRNDDAVPVDQSSSAVANGFVKPH
jgi:predicted aspartyl protease